MIGLVIYSPLIEKCIVAVRDLGKIDMKLHGDKISLWFCRDDFHRFGSIEGVIFARQQPTWVDRTVRGRDRILIGSVVIDDRECCWCT